MYDEDVRIKLKMTQADISLVKGIKRVCSERIFISHQLYKCSNGNFILKT